MTTELATIESVFMPALSISQTIQRYNTVVDFVRTVMREGIDFGTVPSTTKPTLLKPGAEKLCTLFGLTDRLHVVKEVEDWTGEDHGGEPFFYYWYRCQLWRGDRLIAEADGSCNSRETKYRYREAKRLCPACGQATIIKGKAEYGGGWLCHRKQGGCGAKFSDGDQAIEGQTVGRVPNQDVADQVNTIQKMAYKRALIATTLVAVNASEFFTQDLEDLTIVDVTPVIVPVETTGEIAGQPRPSTNGKFNRAGSIARIRAYWQQEHALVGFVPPDELALDLEGMSDADLIGLGRFVKLRLDEVKQQAAKEAA